MKIEDKLYTTKYNVDEKSHLIQIQASVCEKCENKPCLNFCPAEVYKWEKDRLAIYFEGCLECGSCRIGCPYFNIEWHFPRGGFGVVYKFG